MNLLLEKKGASYDWGCVLLEMRVPHLEQLHKQINKDDLYEEDNSYGIEDEPHITLLYGLHNNLDLKKLKHQTTLSQLLIPTLTLYNVSLFENENFDVLKFDVKDETGVLKKINTKLKQFDHEPSEHEFHPHLTIAFLKSGVGQKYVNKFKNLEYKVLPTKFVYSKPNKEGKIKWACLKKSNKPKKDE